MAKIYPTRPFLMMFYGYPGAGKTYFARQFCENIHAAHLQADRIRAELFEEPQYDKQENDIVNQLMNYMTEEFLSAGLSVCYDVNASRTGQRRALADIARSCKAVPIVVWFQMDPDTAFDRSINRDRRKSDDKYAAEWDRTTYETLIERMQNPSQSENYAVVSGKHLFPTQRSAVISKLRDLGVINPDDTNSQVIKPGMVNLVPNNSGRVNLSRRNIFIR
ncbi:MAG: AAA family ATPase [Candidatus Saccharimonadales bacterium]